MTGSLKVKTTSAGNDLYYIRLSYQEPATGQWKIKEVRTGLKTKGNKRKAEAMIKTCIDDYRYLEQPPSECQIDPDIEFCDYLDLWLEEKKCEVCKNTHDSYVYESKTIKSYFKNRHILLRRVTSKDVTDFYHYCLTYGKVSQKDHSRHPLAVRSVRGLKSILYAVFSSAVIKGIIDRNPVIGTKVSNKPNQDFSEEMLFLTEDEIRDMMLFLNDYAPFLVPIAFIGVYYGMRREEILGLKWSAIDFRKKEIRVNHTVTGNKTIYREDKTKTRSGQRTLHLFSTAELCLKKVKQEQEENKKFFGNTYQDTQNYVFTHEDGTPYRPDYISSKFAKAMKAFGRPEITMHKLRYTCVSLLIDKGWDVKKIQYWIGDKDAATVMNVYAQYVRFEDNRAENDLTEMSNKVADFFQ